LSEALVVARRGLALADADLANAVSALGAAGRECQSVEVRLSGLRERDAAQAEIVAKDRETLGLRMVDADFFASGHDAFHLLAPWVPDAIHRKREDLFIAAMEVHRAFIDASAQKMLHNLSVLMDVFSGGAPADPAKRALLPDLWSTLFLAVPVLSTTFASVERMLGDLPPESLGWLLIDEAGQALPQAAAGAILRARRTVVVGDPLQIPPVVSLPERLNAGICAFFRVDQARWAGPDASAQTLADAASRYTGAFDGDQGERIVGVPLLVHRRCQDPMFSISNEVAYDGQMVHAPSPREPGDIGAALGPSAWFDIDGDADSKWCPAEGEQVVRMLQALAANGVHNPDLFIITPFRIVMQELRRRLGEEKALLAELGIGAGAWLKDRVGTIHTVQGREADSVILVLGAPMAGQNGARSWASGTPNIFNVAVSRAKQNLYVVGSRGAWEGMGHARTVAGLLPASGTR
jgi:hypothetical protein